MAKTYHVPTPEEAAKVRPLGARGSRRQVLDWGPKGLIAQAPDGWLYRLLGSDSEGWAVQVYDADGWMVRRLVTEHGNATKARARRLAERHQEERTGQR